MSDLQEVLRGFEDQGWEVSEEEQRHLMDIMNESGNGDAPYWFGSSYEFHGNREQCISYIGDIVMGQEDTFEVIVGTSDPEKIFDMYLCVPSVDTSHLWEIYIGDNDLIYIHSVR